MKPGYEIDYVFILPLLSVYFFICNYYYYESSKLSRLKISTRYMRRPEQLSFAGCSWGTLSEPYYYYYYYYYYCYYYYSVLFIFYQVILFTIADMVASYWLALCFQASHVVSEVSSSYLILGHGICFYECSVFTYFNPIQHYSIKE